MESKEDWPTTFYKYKVKQVNQAYKVTSFSSIEDGYGKLINRRASDWQGSGSLV